MKRPWQVWLLFAVCVLGAFAGMAWLTQQALRADERRRVAEAKAELEQRVSLALWRMDTELAPIIAAEVIRPAPEFRSSEKAVEPPPYVLLQFEALGKDHWLSPQMSISERRDLPRLLELKKAVDPSQLLAQLPKTPLPIVADVNGSVVIANAASAQPNLEGQNQQQFFEGNTSNGQQQQDAAVQVPAPAQQAANKGANFNPEADFQPTYTPYRER